MYGTLKFSIFLVVVFLVGKIQVMNAAQDTKQLADDVQLQQGEVELAKTTSRLTPVYLVAQFSISDIESYTRQYAKPVVQQLQDIGARLLAGSPEPQVLEGKWVHKSTVIIEFPSMSVAKKWYSSVEYKPYRDIRINKLTEGGNMVLVSAH